MKVTNKTARDIDPEKILEELDSNPQVEDKPIEEIPAEKTEEPSEDHIDDPIYEPLPGDVQTVEEDKPINKEERPKVEEKDPEYYKERFKDSSREATTLHFKNQKLERILDEAVDVTEPTVEEMTEFARSKGAHWEDLDEFSKGLLTETFKNSRSLGKIRQAREQARKTEKWADDVEKFVTSEETVSKYPSLEDYQEDFKKFCMRDSRHGMDFEDLVASFLYNVPPVSAKKSKGSLLLSRGNGRTAPEKPAGMDADEVALTRMKNPKEYARLIKSGKINFDI